MLPTAQAIIQGGKGYPLIMGCVCFFDVPGGTWVCARVTGLPEYKSMTDSAEPLGPFGFHIHQNGCCEGDFSCAGEHYNPYNQPHGNHAGDLPVLFSENGLARLCFFTNRFKPTDVIGRSVIIHENPDDFRSQPSGNSGKRIACGIIEDKG